MGRAVLYAIAAAYIAIGEIIKVTLVEQVIEITRPKLLSFHWFAWMYRRWEAVLERLHSIKAWQAIKRQVKSMVARVRQMKSDMEIGPLHCKNRTNSRAWERREGWCAEDAATATWRE
jgi:hypothetical protein